MNLTVCLYLSVLLLLTQTGSCDKIFPSRSRLFCVVDHSKQSGNITCSSNLKIWITGIEVGYAQQRCQNTNYCPLQLLNTTHSYFRDHAIRCQHRSRCQFNAVELTAKYTFENCGFAHSSRNTVKVHYKCVSSLDIPILPGDLLIGDTSTLKSTSTPDSNNLLDSTTVANSQTLPNFINIRRTPNVIKRTTRRPSLVRTNGKISAKAGPKMNKVEHDQPSSGLSEKTALEVVIPLLSVSIIICLIIATACFISGKRARRARTSARPRMRATTTAQQNEGFIYYKTNEELMNGRDARTSAHVPDTIEEEDDGYRSHVDPYNEIDTSDGFRVR